MAKITYYMGAGASYYSCPILNRLSEIMIKVSERELRIFSSTGTPSETLYTFDDSELSNLPEDNREKILWHIGYFAKKGILFNTIDTYARKLELTKDFYKLDLLKMCISVFFDLWENFHESRYSDFLRDKKDDDSKYLSIDNRYKSLFSILLKEKGDDDLELNKNIKFISWNYDLQLESTFRLFLADDKVNSFEELNSKYYRFKRDNKDLRLNNVFHLNGHRGFYSHFNFNNLKESAVEPNTNSTIENYWNSIDSLFHDTEAQNSNFNQYIKYAWEKEQNNFESDWFKEIERVLSETELLVIIGYSFPPFNREIDQRLFSKLNSEKIKKIVYQDPKANSQIIENLFKTPRNFKYKIQIEDEAINQFYLPNEHFIVQDQTLDMFKDPDALS